VTTGREQAALTLSGQPHHRTPARPLVRRVLDDDSLAMDVEKLTTELRSLVGGASADEPAQERRSVVRVQWQLAYAYIAQPLAAA
jgi:hypothetical protein